MRTLKLTHPPLEGPDVTTLQTELVSQHWLSAELAHGTYDAATADAVTRFQRAEGLEPDGVVGRETLRGLANASVRASATDSGAEETISAPADGPLLATEAPPDDPFRVDKGQITFDAEGMESRGPFFSRVPHVPGETSGITIGRGYDLKERTSNGVRAHMAGVGIRESWVAAFQGGVGKHGAAARRYIETHLQSVEITAEQQKALFLVVYDEMERDVRRICAKADVVARYGSTDFARLSNDLLTVVVDLRYRGDYHGTTRRRVQPAIVSNDLAALEEVMQDRDYWMGRFNVPRDRFERRAEFLADALARLA
ncbi:MAG: peptidoglycan-binding protein [Pseudomonadota bacterium]